MSEVTPSTIAYATSIAVPLAVAVVAGSIAYWRYLKERSHAQANTLNALFGEIGSLLDHYSFSYHEMPASTDDDLVVRLRWSQYGEVAAVSDIHRFGFLDEEEIQLLLQLGLRIRNNDIYCKELLDGHSSNPASITEDKLSYLRVRFQYTAYTAIDLLERFPRKQPNLRRRFELVSEKARSRIQSND